MRDVAVYIATSNYKYQQEILNMVSGMEHIDLYAEGEIFGAALFDTERMKWIVKEAEEKIHYIEERLEDERSREIFKQLIEYRLTNKSEMIAGLVDNEMQYFSRTGIIEPTDSEVFIDAGAHDGETTYNFCKWVKEYKKSYSKIYMMEPDSLMFEIMKENMLLKKIENVTAINSGAYSFSGEYNFMEASLTGSSRIVENGEKKIQTIKIDDMVGNRKVTFIKMDIEGAETEALKGAENVIKQWKPKLAISIYHKEDDLWEIPFYIMSKYPWYKIYIRHYSLTTNETVLYATV